VELKCTDEETETLNKHICESSSNQTDWFPQPICGKFSLWDTKFFYWSIIGYVKCSFSLFGGYSIFLLPPLQATSFVVYLGRYSCSLLGFYSTRHIILKYLFSSIFSAKFLKTAIPDSLIDQSLLNYAFSPLYEVMCDSHTSLE